MRAKRFASDSAAAVGGKAEENMIVVTEYFQVDLTDASQCAAFDREVLLAHTLKHANIVAFRGPVCLSVLSVCLGVCVYPSPFTPYVIRSPFAHSCLSCDMALPRRSSEESASAGLRVLLQRLPAGYAQQVCVCIRHTSIHFSLFVFLDFVFMSN